MPFKTFGVAVALAVLPVTAFAQDTGSPSAAVSEARARMRAACGQDVAKYCANIERAKGAMRSCLDAHQTQLSDGCKAARAERAAARAKEKS
jgi:hypothetical protein